MMQFRIGDLVEVRSKEEILATLDHRGCLDGMPFMPEMFSFCGRQFRVYKSAHKTCDYSTEPYACRNLKDTVHLETRCSGEAHGGCQAACLLYWKVAWLKEAAIGKSQTLSAVPAEEKRGEARISSAFACTERTIWQNVQEHTAEEKGPTYNCQMTQIRSATTPLRWWDARQYLKDYLSGNVTLGRMFSGLVYWAFYGLSESGIGVGRAMRWFYQLLSPIWGGSGVPREAGKLPEGLPTPAVNLNLQPGELVRVKSQAEILRTVDTSNRNRGMYWDAELTPYCGKSFRVRGRVNRLIGERTRKMVEMKTPCIILESVVCEARYSSCRMFCPKEMFPYWREAWLERVETPESGSSQMPETSLTSAKR